MTDDLMAEVSKRIKKQRYYENEELLKAFINQVENKIPSPQWLLEFVAEGAREFLRGGKPWQKGKGGRPSIGYCEEDIQKYLLYHYGRISKTQIGLVLDLLDVDGKDVTKTINRAINRGELAFCMAKIGQVGFLKRLFKELIELEFAGLTKQQRRKCVDGLRAGLADLDIDEREPGGD